MGRGWPVVIALALLGCGRIGFDPVGSGADGNNMIPPAGFGPAATSCAALVPTGPVVYVATNGSDTTGDGSSNAPYGTIQMTYDRVAPGTTILVQPGVYGQVDLTRTVSPQRITIAAVTPYTAAIESASLPLSCSGCTGLVLDGLYVHATAAGNPVLHINSGQDVTVHNCIVDNPGGSATLRASGDPVNIVVQRSMLSDGNPPLHAAGVNGAVLEDNLIVQTRAANGPLLWLESPSGGMATIRRNILAGFRGCVDCGILQLRSDTATRVESNLLVSGPSPSLGAVMSEGSVNAIVQFNTVVGDVPGTAFAFTGSQYLGVPIAGLVIANNVFDDPTDTLGDFSDGTSTDIASAVLTANAYWNGGQAITADANDAVKPASDSQAVLADPQLPAYTPYVPLAWDAANLRFSEGSTSVCEAFYKVALQYALPAETSPLVGAASSVAPPADLLGFPRTTKTIGALERH